MLSCRDLAEKASDHIEKKLSFREALSYRLHLFLCGYCRKFVRHLKTTIEFGQRLPEPEPLSDEEAEKIAAQTFEKSDQE